VTALSASPHQNRLLARDRAVGAGGVEALFGGIETLENVLRLEPDPIRRASGEDHRGKDAVLSAVEQGSASADQCVVGIEEDWNRPGLSA
jgi:hypothetical protein